MNRAKFFSLKQVIDVYELLASSNIPIWLDGGWGVDALLEKETRTHQDLDIVIEEKNLEVCLSVLQSIGYSRLNHQHCKAWNFVLGHKDSLEVDVHVVSFDAFGNGIYGPKEKGLFYPAYAFKGIGKLDGRVVKCLTAEYQIESHTGYVLRDKDYYDVAALCKRFNLKNRGGY